MPVACALYWRDLVGEDLGIGKRLPNWANKKVYYLNDRDNLDDALNAF